MRSAAAFSVLLAALASVPAGAQAAASSIAQQAAGRWEQRLAGVRNLTVTQQAVGAELVTYAERPTATSTAWRVRSFTRADGRLRPANAVATLPFAAELLRVFRDNAGRFKLEGTQAVDGKQAYVLTLDGEGAAADLVPGMPLGGGPAERRGAHVRYFIDTADLVPLRAELTMGSSAGGAAGLKVIFTFADYRPAGTLLLPYRVTMAPDTGNASSGITVTVTDVKVNAGPPAGMPGAR